MAHYLDTSALVKLVVAESQTAALRSWLRSADRVPVSSDLARTELMRATRRVAPVRTADARAVLDSLTIVTLTTALYEQAGRLEPAVLRTLDALHLAVALDLGDDLEAVVRYDDRLTEAAHANGLTALAPA